MITRREIDSFFDLEAEASKKSWEALMKLPLEERIRKRKAIKDVTWEKEYKEISDENEWLLKLHFKVNLSDFKEGEALILHKEEFTDGINCNLYKFEDDNTIIVSAFSLPANFKSLYDKTLVLDKNNLDLREHVFSHFTAALPFEDSFWKETLINNQHTPTKENLQACDEELDDTIKNFKISALTSNQREAIVNSMAAQDYYLIQGPPGTGKSFVLGLIILEELLYFHHKVLVIGPNHLAINNALEQMLKLYPQYNCILKIGQIYNAPNLEIKKDNKSYKIENFSGLNVPYVNSNFEEFLFGMTPHSLYSRRARGFEFDTLIIDEAGQMTIPLAMMGMIKAKKVILAGDHKQLPPIVVSDEVPDKMKSSIFQRLITKDNCTMLDVSFRMCKAICDFVSELFYEGAVKPFHEEGSNLIVGGDPLYDFKHPIVLHDVEDEGEQTSDNEAEFITSTIAGFLQRGVKASEIGVLSPFRAQAANVRRHIRKCEEIKEEDRTLITADTVDKMQGQEREVIIFSLTAGNYDYMVDMADFLYNPNKLNVAFSRAKSKLIIVGNLSKIQTLNLSEYPHISKMLHSELVTNI